MSTKEKHLRERAEIGKLRALLSPKRSCSATHVAKPVDSGSTPLRHVAAGPTGVLRESRLDQALAFVCFWKKRGTNEYSPVHAFSSGASSLLIPLVGMQILPQSIFCKTNESPSGTMYSLFRRSTGTICGVLVSVSLRSDYLSQGGAQFMCFFLIPEERIPGHMTVRTIRRGIEIPGSE